jgi:uncharacterized protein YndB with AHSA1/START domain
MNTTSTGDTIEQEITINAPAERVFDAFVSPEERIKWWGRGGRFRVTNATSDFHPGGKWELCFDSNGRPTSVRGEYRTIDRPRLLIFTWLPDWYEDATETLVRVDFTEQAGSTTLRLTHSGLLTEGDRSNHSGWAALLRSLQAYVEQ